jgi:hypothetical protein
VARRSTAASVTFKTIVVGDYMTAEGGGGGVVNANRTAASTWETFTLTDLNGGSLTDGDQIYLQALNGNYVTAEGGGGGAVNANRGAASTWETFIIHRVGGGAIHSGDQIQLQTLVLGEYVSAANGGGAGVTADRAVASTWETFAIGITGAAGGGGAGGGGTAGGTAERPAAAARRAAATRRRPASGTRAASAPAKNVMIFKFLNRTNGKYKDSEVYWSFKSGTINETHSIAAQPTYDMPANSSGRMYFYIVRHRRYHLRQRSDAVEVLRLHRAHHRAGAIQRQHDARRRVGASRSPCGCTAPTASTRRWARTTRRSPRIARSRSKASSTACPRPSSRWRRRPTRPIASSARAPTASNGRHLRHLLQLVRRSAVGANGITIPKPGPNGRRPRGNYPDLSAAIYRHVGSPRRHLSRQRHALEPGPLGRSDDVLQGGAGYNYYAQYWHDQGAGRQSVRLSLMTTWAATRATSRTPIRST